MNKKVKGLIRLTSLGIILLLIVYSMGYNSGYSKVEYVCPICKEDNEDCMIQTPNYYYEGDCKLIHNLTKGGWSK